MDSVLVTLVGLLVPMVPHVRRAQAASLKLTAVTVKVSPRLQPQIPSS